MRNIHETDTANVALIDTVIVQHPTGTELPVVAPNRRVSCLVVSVKQGAIDIFFGGAAGGRLAPDLHFGQTNAPVWVPLPTGRYTFAIVATGVTPTVLGSVIIGGPPNAC